MLSKNMIPIAKPILGKEEINAVSEVLKSGVIAQDTFNIDPDKINEKITYKTKAIIPVHLYGQPADMSAIMEIAEDNNLLVIEDACQAHGATYKNKKVGSFGTGCFSFYPSKNMTTSEGGTITTDSKEVAEKARLIRNHGSREKYYHETLGFNYRMTDIEAAIGIFQLKKLEEFNKIRKRNANYLRENLLNIEGMVIPKIKNNRTHVFNQYTIRITSEFGFSRDEVAEFLRENGVGIGIYYPIPIHHQPLYKDLGYKNTLPISEKLANEVLSLPIHPLVTKKDLDYMVKVFEALK